MNARHCLNIEKLANDYIILGVMLVHLVIYTGSGRQFKRSQLCLLN